MKIEKVREFVSEWNEEALLADGFEEAIVGVCERFGMPPVVAYDREACIDIMVEEFLEDLGYKLSSEEQIPENFLNEAYEQAIEYFEYNTLDAFYGEHTPIFMYRELEV